MRDELTQAQSEFLRNINEDQTRVPAGLSELEALPQDYIDRHKPGPDGNIRIRADYDDSMPVMNFAKSDTLRRRQWEAFTIGPILKTAMCCSE
jgi:thimet oligopeptidase